VVHLVSEFALSNKRFQQTRSTLAIDCIGSGALLKRKTLGRLV
jgi:hypothetical protein